MCEFRIRWPWTCYCTLVGPEYKVGLEVGSPFTLEYHELNCPNRWCYYFNTISCGVSVILLGACYFPPNFQQLHTELTKMQEFKELDYIGLAIYAASMVLILLGFCWWPPSFAPVILANSY